MRGRWTGRLAVACLAVVALTAAELHAAAPRRDWRTVVTPRLRVHYHEGEAALAHRVADHGEAALDALVAIFDHVPALPIEIVVVDDTDGANGFATVLPYNLVTLFAASPEAFGPLGDYDDYLRLLVIHELTHIVHLDIVHGVADWVNAILGRTLVPNGVQPRWFVEGIATWTESRLTGGGRVRSALTGAILRAQLEADAFPDLGEISTLTRRFPGGSSAYLYGGRFLDFVARRHGEAALADISHAYAGRLIPYALNLVAEEATGESFVRMWDAWVEEEGERARAVFEAADAAGLPRGCLVAIDAEQVQAPRWGPGGRLAVVVLPEHDDAELVIYDSVPPCVVDGSTLAPGRVLLRIRSSGGVGAFTDDGRFVNPIGDVFDRTLAYQDLERVELGTGVRRRRTRGARLFDPDVHGDRIVAVQRGPDRTELVTLSLDGEDEPRRLYAPPDGRILGTPRFTADGRAVIASLSARDASRRLIRVELADGAVTELTRGVRDHAPEPTPEGRRVVVSTDRAGVFDLESVELGTEARRRLSAVHSGAFQPAVSADGARLAWIQTTALGHALRVRPLAGPTAAVGPTVARPEVPLRASAVAHPDEPYDPLESLYPRQWLPRVGAHAFGVSLGVELSGRDAVGLHEWRLRASHDTEAGRPSLGVSYANRMLSVGISLAASYGFSSQPLAFVSRERVAGQVDGVFAASLGLDLPLSRWDGGHGLGLSYSILLRRAVSGAPLDDPFQAAPRVDDGLSLGSLGLSWRFSDVRAFTDSFGAARGTSLDASLRLIHPELGAEQLGLSVSARASRFQPMPWARHQVLALRLAAGASIGSLGGRSAYVLGGLPLRDPISDLIEGIGYGPDALRGFSPRAAQGPAYYLATAEYRVPIWTVERGVDTLPGFFDRLHAAVFADLGDTPLAGPRLEDARVGLGAELRVDAAIAYYLPFRLRLGYARGFGEGAIHDVYLVVGGGL